jgi:hypothetical protein
VLGVASVRAASVRAVAAGEVRAVPAPVVRVDTRAVNLMLADDDWLVLEEAA